MPRSYRTPGRPLRPGHLHRERGPPDSAAGAGRGGQRGPPGAVVPPGAPARPSGDGRGAGERWRGRGGRGAGKRR